MRTNGLLLGIHLFKGQNGTSTLTHLHPMMGDQPHVVMIHHASHQQAQPLQNQIKAQPLNSVIPAANPSLTPKTKEESSAAPNTINPTSTAAPAAAVAPSGQTAPSESTAGLAPAPATSAPLQAKAADGNVQSPASAHVPGSPTSQDATTTVAKDPHNCPCTGTQVSQPGSVAASPNQSATTAAASPNQSANAAADPFKLFGAVPAAVPGQQASSPVSAPKTGPSQDLAVEKIKVKSPMSDDNIRVADMEKILKNPGQAIPWKWWQQCYNDNVIECRPILRKVMKDFTLYAKEMDAVLRNPKTTFLEHLGNDHLVRSMYAMGKLLADKTPTLKDEDIPYHVYFALELLFGMGFEPILAGQSSVTERKVNISAFVASKGQLRRHLGPVARLGFHRVAKALLVLPKVVFDVDDTELRDLLNDARKQPFVLTVFLKNIGDKTLRTKVANTCVGCNVLAEGIHHTLLIQVPNIPPICLPNGELPVQSIHSTFLKSLGKKLKWREDQVMLARSFLNIVFNISFSSTYCPNCHDFRILDKSVGTSTIINAILQSYCTPRSKYQIRN